jgi:hypothetical protein
MRLRVLDCCLLLAAVALAQDKPAKSYPEQGRVTQVEVFVPDLSPLKLRRDPHAVSGHNANDLPFLACTWTFKIDTGTQIFTVQTTGAYQAAVAGMQKLPIHGTRVLCDDDIFYSKGMAGAIPCHIMESGGPIDFRVEGKALYTADGKKEHKYNIVKAEPKPAKPTQ